MSPKVTIIGLIRKKGRFESLVVFVKVKTEVKLHDFSFEI